MKPVACGNHVYSTGNFSSAATMSAILFSKPSPLSFENGMLAGSAQTRSAVRLTRSIRCPYAAVTTMPNASSATSRPLSSLLVTEAGLLMRFSGGGLIGPFGRASARQDPVRARLQVDVDIFEIARDVAIIAHRRHLALLVGTNLLLAGGDNEHELGVAHRLQRLDQGWAIGRALAIRPVTHVTLGMIAAETRERVPVDRTVAGDVVGRVAVSRCPFAVAFLLGRLCDDAERTKSGNEHQCNTNALHINPRRLMPQIHDKAQASNAPARAARAGAAHDVPVTAARTRSACRREPCSRAGPRSRRQRQDPRSVGSDRPRGRSRPIRRHPTAPQRTACRYGYRS